jgi:HSP20 family protein
MSDGDTCGSGRRGVSGDLFEILVTTHARRGHPTSLDEDLSWRPATDAYETEEAFVVQMDLSGMNPADIEVTTDGVSLTVRGTRHDIGLPGRKHYSKMEISVGPFARRIGLPVPVVAEEATARYVDGFLFVSLRKGESRDTAKRRIDVDD